MTISEARGDGDERDLRLRKRVTGDEQSGSSSSHKRIANDCAEGVLSATELHRRTASSLKDNKQVTKGKERLELERTEEKSSSDSSRISSILLSILCVFGIFVFFLAAGAAHEKLYAIGGRRLLVDSKISSVSSWFSSSSSLLSGSSHGRSAGAPLSASESTVTDHLGGKQDDEDDDQNQNQNHDGAARATDEEEETKGGLWVEEKFVYSIFLVFVWCVVNALLSLLCLLVTVGRKELVDMLLHYADSLVYRQLAVASSSYVASLIASNYALTHVNYPTQVLVKSAKTVPIVVGGYVQYRRVYPWYDYLAVCVVTVALTVFNLEKLYSGDGAPKGSAGDGRAKTGGEGVAHHHLPPAAPAAAAAATPAVGDTDTGLALFLGTALLVLALVCDGITGPRQDRLLAQRPKLNIILAMFLMNVFAAVWSGVAFLVFEHLEAVRFCMRYPSSWYYVGAFSVASSFGQFFVFGALRLMGSLHLAMVTTVRKFCSIVISILLYKHNLSLTQWACIAAVFSSLSLQTVLSNAHKKQKRKNREGELLEKEKCEQNKKKEEEEEKEQEQEQEEVCSGYRAAERGFSKLLESEDPSQTHHSDDNNTSTTAPLSPQEGGESLQQCLAAPNSTDSFARQRRGKHQK